MKKIQVVFGILCFVFAPLFFASCDAIKDFSTIDVPIGTVEINIPLDLSSAAASPMSLRMNAAGNEFVTFSGESQPISLQDEMFHSIQSYLGDQITLIVTDVKIKITVTDGSGTVIKGFTSTTKEAAEILCNYTKDGDINLGEDFSDRDFTTYAKTIFTAIQNGKTITIGAAGETDIDPSEITGATVAVATIIPTLKAEIKLFK